jgi:hypothetical protein
VLESLQAIPVPTLKRALRGPAGPRICEVALRVVLHGDYAGINPRLGKELERVFAQAGHGALRRSAHQPFLRLGADCSSVEIVGPQQDASLVGPSGLTWIVDGRRFPTPRTDEFVLTVTDQRRVGVELTGLVLGAMPLRTFVLSLDDLTEPFLLFEARTYRQRRVSGPVPAGDYWLLHRTTDVLVGADPCYEWPDGERALSFCHILPGADVRLESEHGGPWRFAAALTPFFDAVGACLIDDTRETICFGWAEMPCVWLPREETASEPLRQWHVHLSTGTLEQTWALSHTGEEAGGMAKCRVEACGALAALAPGLHRLEFTLRRGERSRHEAKATYWFWQGLLRHDPSGFHLSGPAMNLLPAECRGFGVEEGAIRHLADHHRRHTLVFDMDGSRMAFHWAQPGVFLESLERRPGTQAAPRAHLLGEAFPASCNSARWLRIWLAGQREWDIVVAGKVWHRGMGVDHRAFVELSCASLATAFPEGGDIRLRMHGRERLLARFSSPLHPLALDAEESPAHVGFRFHFSERVLWVRPGLREWASGQRRVLDGQAFGPSGRCLFVSEDLPPIECSSVVDEQRGTALHLVTLHVPKQGWPDGLWVIELEVRRDENADWEPVALGGRDYAPLVIWASKGQTESTTRARLLWASVDPGAPLHDCNLDASGCTELFELLVDVIGLRQRRIAAAARRHIVWVNQSIRALSQLAGRVARQTHDNGLQAKLLHLACQDASHVGFVHLPELLALPASAYRELPSGDPLNDALRRCGALAAADSVAEAVAEAMQHDGTLFDMSLIACFANFAHIAATPDGAPVSMEFRHFAHERYWQSVIGALQHDRLVPDWSGESALGKAHMVWACSELVRRYEHATHALHLAAANRLLHCAPDFRVWLHQRLGSHALMSPGAWHAPWPCFVAPEVDFLEATPRFASLFALAVRCAAAGLLERDEALTWLERHVGRRWMAEGIALLVGLAPELFGHLLLFWELIVRTAPH